MRLLQLLAPAAFAAGVQAGYYPYGTAPPPPPPTYPPPYPTTTYWTTEVVTTYTTYCPVCASFVSRSIPIWRGRELTPVSTVPHDDCV